MAQAEEIMVETMEMLKEKAKTRTERIIVRTEIIKI